MENYKCKRLFVLVDYTNSFTIGSFANKESIEIDSNIRRRLSEALNNTYTKIVVLIDSHDSDNYMKCREGIHLPILHSHTSTERKVYGKTGELLCKYWNGEKYESNDEKVYFIEKNRFGTLDVTKVVNKDWIPDNIILCGVATNICILSNAIILMTEYPDSEVYIYEDSVASYNTDLHNKSLEIMENLGINIIR